MNRGLVIVEEGFDEHEDDEFGVEGLAMMDLLKGLRMECG